MMGRERLDALLMKQYKQYRQRMNYLSWYFGWDRREIRSGKIR